jgi:hypothetical protein
MDISPKLINHFQSGFIHNRFIGYYGFACRLVMEDVSKSKSMSEGLGVMLDETNVYNRIHPEYLCKVLKRFGFQINLSNVSTTFSLAIQFQST